MAILLLMLNAFLRSFCVYAVCPEIKWWTGTWGEKVFSQAYIQLTQTMNDL